MSISSDESIKFDGHAQESEAGEGQSGAMHCDCPHRDTCTHACIQAAPKVEHKTNDAPPAPAPKNLQNRFSRTQMLFGKPAIETLHGARVAVFGVGGVGGYVVEVLARSGVGAIDIIDDDKVCLTNINRQIIATSSTVGQYKVDVAKKRILDIFPRCQVQTYKMFYTPANADTFDLSVFDYVVDCIDTVSAKLELVKRCFKANIPMISCMGAANKIDPTRFRICDIYKTQGDPLARVMRKELRKLGIPSLKCVYSDEPALKPIEDDTISCRFHCICPDKNMRKCTERRTIPASNAFVPAAEGLIAGGEVVKDIINRANTFRVIPQDVNHHNIS